MYTNDKRIAITPDAGATNFVRGAMHGCEYITGPITCQSNAHDLGLRLHGMVISAGAYAFALSQFDNMQ